MSCWTTTVPNSLRNSAPVGQASRQPACVQCLHTSERHQPPDLPVPRLRRLRVELGQRLGVEHAGLRLGQAVRLAQVEAEVGPGTAPGRPTPGIGRSTVRACSMKATCRQVFAPSWPVLSYDIPDSPRASSVAVRVVHRERVPLLAGHLAGLAADAHRGVGEEPDPGRVVRLVAVHRLDVGQRPEQPVARVVLLQPRARRAHRRHARSLSVAVLGPAALIRSPPVPGRPPGWRRTPSRPAGGTPPGTPAAPARADGVPAGCRRSRPCSPGCGCSGRG